MSFKYERQNSIPESHESGLSLMRARWNMITPEQKSILRDYLIGLKRKDIASMRSLSTRTIDAHLNNINKILGLSFGKSGNQSRLKMLWSEFEDKAIKSEQAEEDTLS